MKEAREFSVLGPLMGGFGSQAFLGCVHSQGPNGPLLKPAAFVFLPDEVVSDVDLFRRLWTETEQAGDIDHVNVIGVMGIARLEEGYARVVEYADAESLRSVYRRAQTMKRPMPPDVAVALVADACMGVHYAHELGDAETGKPWIHGGVRPETLQVSFAGMAKVTGYGAQVLADSIRKKGGTGIITRDTYTSPEQIVGGRGSATILSDVYALGCILYEALTGKPPFSGDKDLAEAMIRDELSRPSLVGVTQEMADVVLKATQKKAVDRYATALDMRMDLFERCEPANEGDVKRYLDDLFPPNAIPRATRIQMLRTAQRDFPEITGRLLTAIPAELTLEHRERAAIPNDDDVEARVGQRVEDLPEIDADELTDDPQAEAAAAALLGRSRERAATTAPPPAPTAPSTAAPATVPAGALPTPPPATNAPPSWQAQNTLPPQPSSATNQHEEATDPSRLRRRPTLAPLPPPAPAPQVIYKTPTGVILGIGLSAGAAIALAVVVLTRPPAAAPVAPVAPTPVAAVVDAGVADAPAADVDAGQAAAAEVPSKPTPTPRDDDPPPKAVAKGPGTIVVTSDPPLEITIDGKAVGKGDVTEEVKAGRHTVVGRGAGTSLKRTVTVRSGKTENVRFVVQKGALAIDAPPGCDVIIDGKRYGKTPLDPIELVQGSHNVVVKQGTVEYKRRVPIQPNLESVLSVSFHPG